MAEIKIGKIIQEKRKGNHLTQEELASYMGISKSSVSKWESGQTYPDIYLLPKLATFFDISMDTLMGYEPELTKKKIKEYYEEMSKRFGSEPFEIVYEDYKNLIKKYYASQPFLLQMAVLLLNYGNFAPKDRGAEVLEFIISLARRIKQVSHETFLIAQANSIEALCQLQLGEVDETLQLLNYDISIYLGEEQILAQAYATKGELLKAQEVLQVSQFQHLVGGIVTSIDSLQYEIENIEKFDEIVSRLTRLMAVYDIRHLHPAMIMTLMNNLFINYTQQKRFDKGLEALSVVVELMLEQRFPMEIHGDDYFNLMDDWISKQIDLYTNMPRDEKTIKNTLIQFYETNPLITENYGENEQFKHLIKKLKENVVTDNE